MLMLTSSYSLNDRISLISITLDSKKQHNMKRQIMLH